MATIYAPTSPVAGCSVCGVQRQFHSDNGIPHAHGRDHDFVAMTLDDFEPEDLDAEQLVTTICQARDASRVEARRAVLRAQIKEDMGIDWDDLLGAMAPDLIATMFQYVSDLRYPPTGDSVQRRIERAEAAIAMACAA